jgi:hypothetical protein
MHSMSLNHFSNFILFLNSIRNDPTQNECFCMHILFTTIYLLHKQKLNHGNYSEQELNIGILYKIMSMMCTCIQSFRMLASIDIFI